MPFKTLPILPLLLNVQLFAQSSDSTLAWTPIGPNGSNTYSNSGQVSAIAIDPRDSNVVYIGTAAGGVWKTTNGGTNWTPLTDDQPLTAIGSVAIDPANPDTIYAGTGSRFLTGGSILKSTDAGITWRLIPGPFAGPPFLYPLSAYARGQTSVWSVAPHPTDGKTVLAAAALGFQGMDATTGIFRSSDAGTTWTRVLAIGAASVAFTPENPNVAFAGGTGGVYRSNDAGLTWNLSNGSGANVLPPDFLNVALPARTPGMLYAQSFVQSSGIYRSVDNGQNWSRVSDPPQGCIGPLHIHPTNPDVLFTGDINLCRSLNGGSTWSQVGTGANGVRLHADVHSGAFTGDGSTFFSGNDGGIWRSPNPSEAAINWTNLNATLATILFYPNSLAILPSDPNVSYAGTQDNGEFRYTGNNTWNVVTCGDGGTTVLAPSLPLAAYAICQNDGRVYKYIQDVPGSTQQVWAQSVIGIVAADMQHSPQEALAIDPSNSQRLYFGNGRIYRSDDAAASWQPISLGGESERVITVAPSDPNTVWAGEGLALDFLSPPPGVLSGGHVRVTRNALASNPTWTDRTAGLPFRNVTQIAVDTLQPLTAYVTLANFAFGHDAQGHVFKTTNGGMQWTDISANLPNLSANDIVLDPDFAGTLYVATDNGVYASINDGASWFPLGTGLPNAPVYSMKMFHPGRILRAATWGRSAWDLSLIDQPMPPAPFLNGANYFYAPLAAAEFASFFGDGLTTEILVADDFPLTLGGVSLALTDRNSLTLPAAIHFVSPGQVNFLVPDGLALGPVTVTLTTASGAIVTGNVRLASSSPGLFSANSTGHGPAAAIAVRYSADGIIQAWQLVFDCGAGCVTVPIDLGAPTDLVFLELFGTGIRNHGALDDTALYVGEQRLQISYAGAQNQYPGLDQVNALLPRTLAGAGEVMVYFSVDGHLANPVTIRIQ